MGLADIMEELFAEGWKSSGEAAEEIISRLEDRNNYIPSSERVRREYNYLLLNEYRKFIDSRSENGR